MDASKATNPNPDKPNANPEALEQFLSIEDAKGGTLEAIEALLRAKLEELQSAYDEYLRTRDALLRLIDKQVPSDWNPDGLVLEVGGRRISVGDDSARRKPLGKRQESIVSLVREFPGIEVWKIAEVEGISPSRVSQIVSSLVEEGRLERTDVGLKVASNHKNKPTKGTRQT